MDIPSIWSAVQAAGPYVIGALFGVVGLRRFKRSADGSVAEESHPSTSALAVVATMIRDVLRDRLVYLNRRRFLNPDPLT